MYTGRREGVGMAARTAQRGLSTLDLEGIRAALAGGRRPKVVFTQAAGQIAGQQGQVVELVDPAVNDDWVVVRFGRDELPFSPADLVMAPKAPRKAVKAVAAPPGDGSAAVAAVSTSVVPSPREESSVPRPAQSTTTKTATAKTVAGRTAAWKAATGGDGGAQPPVAGPQGNGRAPAARPVGASGNPADPAAGAPDADAVPAKAGRAKAAPAAEAAGGAAPGAGPGAAGGAAPAARPKPARKPKPPATLTVTLSYADGEWTVAAQQGSRSLAKPYLIRAAEALKMVGMLDVPGVHEAVEEIVAAARAQAEAEAERLRAELAEIEERLAELREAG
jgi:hypothetical protein